MKKWAFGLLTTSVLLVSSCNKCVVCDFNGEKVEHCQKDFIGGQYGAFKQTIKEFEDAGYECVEK